MSGVMVCTVFDSLTSYVPSYLRFTSAPSDNAACTPSTDPSLTALCNSQVESGTDMTQVDCGLCDVHRGLRGPNQCRGVEHRKNVSGPEVTGPVLILRIVVVGTHPHY